MAIVVDTNVVIAALIRRGAVRELLLTHPGSFFTPETCVKEVWEHRRVWGRDNASDDEMMEEVLLLAEDVLTVVPEHVYSKRMTEAANLTDDPDDAPVIALALSMDNDGLWTFNTRDFSKARLKEKVRILGTGDVRMLMDE